MFLFQILIVGMTHVMCNDTSSTRDLIWSYGMTLKNHKIRRKFGKKKEDKPC